MMILEKKEDCCGCLACVQKCPRKCIKSEEDSEGFLYPSIDMDVCVKCDICKSVCPILTKKGPQNPIKIYSAKNKNENIQLDSSSGGVFTFFAQEFIEQNGVVFGAMFNHKWEVIHDYCETLPELSKFRRSKYVQSYIGNTYSKAEAFLKQGRKVLFSGTPCQIAGLKTFLKKEYDNLLTIDFICHGVPSPKVWNTYLKEKLNSNHIDNTTITDINFRNKIEGWRSFSFSIKSGEKYLISERAGKNTYLKGFLNELYSRPSCHQCSFKNFASSSDITIGDFWGIWNVFPDFYDEKGTSVVFFNKILNMTNFENQLHLLETNIQSILPSNKHLIYSSIPHPKRERFFKQLNKGKITNIIEEICAESLFYRIKKKIIKIIKIIIGK